METAHLPIYLDYNGTTPLAPEVIEAMRPYLEIHFGNPSSSHPYGLEPRKALGKAREQVADLLNCAPEEIVFTSGGTESNNHALKGICAAHSQRGNHMVTSAIEHPAVLEVCKALARTGVETTIVPVDRQGRLSLTELERAIRPETILISVMHSNNEVGILQPIKEIASLGKRHNLVIHTDAAQSAGKVFLNVDELGVDLLSLAGHKLYAPKGVGALYIRRGTVVENFCHGAGQEGGRRGGTENIPAIVGLGKACELAKAGLAADAARLAQLRERLHAGLHTTLGSAVLLNGHPEFRLPNTVSLAFHGISSRHLLEKISGRLAVSAGAACHADCVRPSHVLVAMQVPPEVAATTLRFSIGRMTTEEEIDQAVRIVTEAVRQLGAVSPA